MIKSYNLHNIIKKATRISKFSATCIDHFYTNFKTSIKHKYIVIDPISDHFPLFCTINIKLKQKRTEPLFIRNFKKMNVKKLMSEASAKTQSLLTDFQKNPSSDINLQFQTLTDAIKDVVNKNTPLEKLSRKNNRLNQNPWLSKDILKDINTKNKIYKKLVKNRFSDTDLHKEYKKLRNE